MRNMLILVTFGLAAAAAPAQEPSGPAPDLKALADSCDAHKFETTVIVDGNRGKKVKICGQPGQSDADWLVTLKDSAAKVEADSSMAPEVKSQIVAALRTEIERIEGLVALVDSPSTATIAVNHGPVSIPEPTPQYSSVPPLPAPLPRAAPATATARTAAAGSVQPSAPLVIPRVTLRCASPRESFGTCAGLERDTQLLVRADEDLAPGAGLRFVRGGDNRAEIALGAMKRGETLRERLPARVCAGVMRGKVEVQVVSKGQVANRLGPYDLSCKS